MWAGMVGLIRLWMGWMWMGLLWVIQGWEPVGRGGRDAAGRGDGRGGRAQIYRAEHSARIDVTIEFKFEVSVRGRRRDQMS